jgi:hypothetical protein
MIKRHLYTTELIESGTFILKMILMQFQRFLLKYVGYYYTGGSEDTFRVELFLRRDFQVKKRRFLGIITKILFVLPLLERMVKRLLQVF